MGVEVLMTMQRLFTVFSFLIAALAFIASAAGLFIPGLYRDNDLVTAALRGNDLVTLPVAGLLVAAVLRARHGSLGWRLVWLGTLAYMLYNYAFYLFGAAFNAVFLLYVALVALSIYALVFGLMQTDPVAVCQRFRPATPARGVSGFMIFFALFLGGLWVSRVVGFLATGQVPQDILQTAHPTGVVYALDLTLLVPALVTAALLLWRRAAWGYVLAPALLVKASAYGIALIAMSPFAASAGVANAWELTPLWALLTIGSLISGAALFRHLQS